MEDLREEKFSGLLDCLVKANVMEYPEIQRLPIGTGGTGGTGGSGVRYGPSGHRFS